MAWTRKPALSLQILVGVRTQADRRALTVAGQWRNFTAFPNILVIAVDGWILPLAGR